MTLEEFKNKWGMSDYPFDNPVILNNFLRSLNKIKAMSDEDYFKAVQDLATVEAEIENVSIECAKNL
ncbi:MAG: hypothetical protein IKT40_12920 [Bacilli bacterium]|nr:hypothetical protein [Bacilli bacterium]